MVNSRLSVCVWLHVSAEVESRYIGWLTYIAQLGYNEVTSHPAPESGLILLCMLKTSRTIAAGRWLAVVHISLLDERTSQYQRSLIVSAFVHPPQQTCVIARFFNSPSFLSRLQAILGLQAHRVALKRRGTGTVGSLPEFQITTTGVTSQYAGRVGLAHRAMDP